MPRPRSDSRDKIVEAARVLLRRQGYHGSGLAQIIESSGAPRGSVYFLFPGGKEEIAVAAVEVSARTIPELITAAQQESATLREWIDSVVAHFAAELTESQFTDGCPITTMALDTAPASHVLTAALRGAYDAWLAAVAAALHAYSVPGAVVPGLAVTMLASLEGALVLCRVQQSVQPLHDVAAQLTTLAETHCLRPGSNGT
ncbi:TetR/AcrR family transcriptional regulator [Lentzea tibetensis]|uniref:TetR/AcrR family transcriptional regulator n=1 Tax=Lentzea tibetensis TaxID=2591470 RepID=UPI00164789BC|nr:TetR/AcrR family transcriptional regulator [Lentzea tibetensis]